MVLASTMEAFCYERVARAGGGICLRTRGRPPKGETAMVLFLLDEQSMEKPPPIAELPGIRRSSSTASMPEMTKRRSPKKLVKRSTSSAGLLPPMQHVTSASNQLPRPTLQRQYTGVGMAPSYSRGSSTPMSSSVFSTAPVVSLDVKTDDGDLDLVSPERQARRARAAKQRAERAGRPPKNRGAHANPPLRSEVPAWKQSLPSKTADAADKFDRQQLQRWDQAESVYFALSRDLTHIAKQQAYDLALMELMMNRYAEPTNLAGVQRINAKQRKAKPKKPWKLQESIWGTQLHAE